MYYMKNYRNISYEVDEADIKHIMKDNVKCVQENQTLNLVFLSKQIKKNTKRLHEKQHGLPERSWSVP